MTTPPIVPSPQKPTSDAFLEALLGALNLPKLPKVIMNYGDGNGSGNLPEPPLESVYPLEALLVGGALLRGLFGFLGGLARIGATETGVGAAEAGGGAAEAGGGAVETGLTEHGILRAGQRGISSVETEEAIQSAQQAGNVTTQLGKYGTPQNIYRGSNGVTAVVETSGRNAGKIITIYRH